jgi:hypothetical protein
MIIYKQWKKIIKKDGQKTRYICEGWFLFGVLPLYIKQIDLDIPIPEA